MNKLKYILSFSLISIFAVGCANSNIAGMPNPWIDCGQDIQCAKNKAGFNFPIELRDCSIRAMEDMIEVTYLLNNAKTVTIRKSKKYDGKGDISGDYNNYPINKEIIINNRKFNVRGNGDNFYVSNFSTSKAHYAIMCDDGLTLDETENIYEIIKKADKF